MKSKEQLKKMKDAEHRISSYIHKIGKIAEQINKVDNGKPIFNQGAEIQALHSEKVNLIAAIKDCSEFIQQLSKSLLAQQEWIFNSDHYEQLDDAGMSLESHELKEEEE